MTIRIDLPRRILQRGIGVLSARALADDGRPLRMRRAPLSASLLKRIARSAVLGAACLASVGCHSWRLGPGASCESPVCRECAEGTCHPLFCISGEKYSRCIDEFFASHEAVRRANRSLRKCYATRPSFDFKDGYRQAFIDIALGGDGLLPAVPPQRYWSTCYRTAVGHQRAQNWYAGYVAGSNRALFHCRYRDNDVPTSGVPAFEKSSVQTQAMWHGQEGRQPMGPMNAPQP